MLSVHVMRNVDYYTELARTDYYTAGGEPPGRWCGAAAMQLGLAGCIDNAVFRLVMEGYAPDGTALCQNAGGERAAGLDLTFSAPKSVSVAWAVADEALRHAIQQAQAQAVHAGVAFLQQQAAQTRRGKQGLVIEPVAGLIVATFEHSTSRAQDPQLHTHALIANLAPRLDGTWGTLDTRNIFLWQKAAGAMYRAELAQQLRQLGFTIEPDGQSFHVAQVPSAVCQQFGKRTQAIKAALTELGVSSSASRIGNALKLSTREHKQAVNRPELFARWQVEAEAAGLSREQLQQGLRRAITFSDPMLPNVDELGAQLTAAQSLFRQQDLFEAIAVQGQWQGFNAAMAEAHGTALLSSPALVALGHDSKRSRIFTTPAQQQLEQHLLQQAFRLRADTRHRLPEPVIAQAIAAEEAQQRARRPMFTFSEEQCAGVRAVCQSGMDVLQGSAGAGKSTSMAVVARVHQQQGYVVLGCAIAKKAADNLAHDAGIATYTIAKMLDELQRGRQRFTARTLLIVDEAGQVGSPMLAALLDAAQTAGAKLVLTGEDKQLDAIEHGGLLRYLSRDDVLDCERIETIVRQREDWARQAVMQLRDGDAAKALATFAQRGLLRWGETADATRQALVQAWQQLRKAHPERSVLLLAQRWQDVRALSEQVQAQRRADGELGGENIALDCVISDKTLRFAFSRGDRIRLGKNDYARGFTNGTLGTIERITAQLNGDVRFTVRTDAGRTLSFNASEYADERQRPYLALAYALPVYASQGVTVDETLIYYSSGMDRAHSYVAGSRHREHCHWFINREEIDTQLHRESLGKAAIGNTQRLEMLAELMASDRHKTTTLAYLSAQELAALREAARVRTASRELAMTA